MPCYRPLKGFHKLGGGWPSTPQNSNTMPMTIPCGQCIGCRIDKKQSWALRLTHEARSHSASIFLTLTYNDQYRPRGGTLVKRHAQLFMKRLRGRLAPGRVRFFLVGEYGDRQKRPHYHALIFGWWPEDGKLESVSEGRNYYSSELIASVWSDPDSGDSYGFHNFSEVTVATCKYVSHYVVKKIGGDMAKDHYTRITQDGEMYEVIPEFALMSRRPGIGHDTYRKFQSDYDTHDCGLLEGRRIKMPAYYDKLKKRDSEAALELVKSKRKKEAKKHKSNNTPERLAAREAVAIAKANFNNGRKAQF